jgi:hypothetical protein
MRWDNLFDDLEGQLEHELTSEEIDLRAEEERLRLGRMSLRDRLVAIHASESRESSYSIRIQLNDGSHLAVRLATVGRDWFSADVVADGPRPSQCVVPLAAIATLLLSRAQIAQSLTSSVRPGSERGLSARLSLSFVLRDLCRRRASLELRLLDSTVFGTIDRVGRDHLDLAVHEPGSARRESAVSQYRVIPFGQLLFVRV